jgi:hypothetical protein
MGKARAVIVFTPSTTTNLQRKPVFLDLAL